MQQQKLLIVAATREAPSPFMESAPLGRSLRRLSFDRRLEARPAFNNRDGLPAVYNRQISEENREKILLFVHDDIWLDDCFVYDRLQEALVRFEIVGLAGNTRRQPGQPAWGFASLLFVLGVCFAVLLTAILSPARGRAGGSLRHGRCRAVRPCR